ncbi:MAG: hypothetical protein WCG93_09945 [Paludibacter sp.]
MKNYYNQSTFLIVISIMMLSVFSSCKSEGDKKSKSLFSINAGNENSFGGHGSSTSASDNLYANNLSNYKSKANTSGSSAASGLDMPSMAAPSARIEEADMQNAARSRTTSTSSNVNQNQNQSNGFKSSNTDLNQGFALVADANTTIKERTVITKGEKASLKSSAASSKAKPHKVDGLPGEVGLGSLPMGDGIWILLSFVCVYAGKKLFFNIA